MPIVKQKTQKFEDSPSTQMLQDIAFEWGLAGQWLRKKDKEVQGSGKEKDNEVQGSGKKDMEVQSSGKEKENEVQGSGKKDMDVQGSGKEKENEVEKPKVKRFKRHVLITVDEELEPVTQEDREEMEAHLSANRARKLAKM
jgi:hypothetical protein